MELQQRFPLYASPCITFLPSNTYCGPAESPLACLARLQPVACCRSAARMQLLALVCSMTSTLPPAPKAPMLHTWLVVCASNSVGLSARGSKAPKPRAGLSIARCVLKTSRRLCWLTILGFWTADETWDKWLSMSCFVVTHDCIVSTGLYGLSLLGKSTVCVLNVSGCLCRTKPAWWMVDFEEGEPTVGTSARRSSYQFPATVQTQCVTALHAHLPTHNGTLRKQPCVSEIGRLMDSRYGISRGCPVDARAQSAPVDAHAPSATA